ncbi:MAG TPA: ABC transporter permease, partial [Candidatus Tectomicrobia bacterium]|nr:ABC transporter permease [Candidatus Tectomicrobia bacterium]
MTRTPVPDRTRALARREHRLVRVAALLGLVALWEAVTRTGWVPPLFLPSPLGVLASRAEMAASGEVLQHLGASLGRIALGFAA